MNHLSYIELNIVCMILLGIVFFRQFNNRSIISSSQIYMRRLILTSCILCATDILAIMCRGQSFEGARLMIEVSNLLYIEAMPLISMFWFQYVCAKVGKNLSKTQGVFTVLPLAIFTLVAITNPFTDILFSIDQNNLYVRGPGVFLHWIVSWGYLLVAGGVSHKAYKNAQSWSKKNEYKPLLIFIIFPTIGCVVQMLAYGITAVQAGIALSIVLVNYQIIDNRISMDELTGVNNRKEMNIYVDRLLNKYKSVQLNVWMIDINRFKQINDTLGHNVGDKALQDVANALKNVCDGVMEHMFLCRFGGDEFVIIGKSTDAVDLQELTAMLHKEVKDIAAAANRPYDLSVSVGCATGECQNMADFEMCIKKADDDMYIQKGEFKKAIKM